MTFLRFLERYAAAVIAAAMSVVAAAVSATVALLFQLSSSVAGLQVGQEHTGLAVQDVRSNLSNSYTVDRANEAHDRIWVTDKDQYDRIKVLENKVRELQTQVDHNAVRLEHVAKDR